MKRKKKLAGTPDIDTLRGHLKQKPDDGQAWLALTRALLDRPPGPELHHAAGQCLRFLPDNHQAWILAAAVQQRIRGTEAALLWLEQAIARNPDQPAPHLALAKLRQNRFQLVEALAAANRAVELSGGAAEALSARGDINLQGMHLDEALSDYRQAQLAGVNDANLMHQIGCCYFGLDEHEAAETHLRKAISRDPRHHISRFVLALSYLKRTELARGEAVLADIVREAQDDPQTRHKAATALAVLEEHRRLESYLRQALESGDVSGLQMALEDTPEILLQRDERTIDRFRQLAAIFSSHSFDTGLLSDSGLAEQWAFLEAETLCAAEIDAEQLAGMFQQLVNTQGEAEPIDESFRDAWQTVRDRTDFDPASLQGPNGEAWLRYWHARLLRETPQAYPGQFKAVDAALPGKPKITPEFVVPLCREILGQLLPTVPAGLARALYLYTSLRVMQPFSDGNSRLARFLMNAELEAAGQPTIVIPVSWSSRLHSALDDLLFQGRLEPLVEAVAGAQADAARQLSHFG